MGAGGQERIRKKERIDAMVFLNRLVTKKATGGEDGGLRRMGDDGDGGTEKKNDGFSPG